MRTPDELLHFYKVSGAGNHFVLLDVRKREPRLLRGPLVRTLCAQGHSVGADGVLFIEKSKAAHFRLSYFNSDGNEAAMCGNGARCAAVYAFERELAPASMTIQTGSGLVRASVGSRGVELNVGRPKDLRTGVEIRTSAGLVRGDFVNTGVPHFVVLPRAWRKLSVDALGREIRYHRAFRGSGTNVNFVRIVSKGLARVRTYERGVEAETLACGTGAVAVAVCLTARDLLRPPVGILTQGGDTLSVRFTDGSNPLSDALLSGPAQVIYEGDISTQLLRSVARKLNKR